jgi:hypothetical protein
VKAVLAPHRVRRCAEVTGGRPARSTFFRFSKVDRGSILTGAVHRLLLPFVRVSIEKQNLYA